MTETIDLVTTTIRRADFRDIIHALTEDHPTRQYWTDGHRQALSHQMLQAIDAEVVPFDSDENISIDGDQWALIATDLAHIRSSISPPQWATEIARCVVFEGDQHETLGDGA